ncbi:MAG: hypothetical protein LBR67_09155, partial [Dysgonamonadaceae bacterium]|nr:hypothetical protein [Dysgonamonadaceae bacterium]
MKHIINKLFTTAILFILIGVTACNEDKGNYDYQDINSVEVISGISAEYAVYLGYQLQITPILGYTAAPGADEFTYKWYYYDSSASSWELLQEGLTLDQEIAGVIGRNRTMAFEAHNEKTDISYRKTFKIVLTAPIGYVALCETADGYDVDMVSYVSTDSMFLFAKNVLDGMESEVPHHEGQRPVDIVTAAGPTNLNLYPTPAFADGTNYTVYILTDQYTTRLASKDFSWRSEYNIESSVEGNSELDVNYKQQGKPIVAQKLKITDQQGRR